MEHKTRTYFTTRWGGDRPFKVLVDIDKISVWIPVTKIEYEHPKPEFFTKCILEISNYGQLFVGTKGHTILFETKRIANEYVCIGSDHVYSFIAKSPIETFVPNLGNGGCPCVYAIDEKENVYLLTDNTDRVCFPMPDNKDPYDFW
jgi:hypothetical protein